MFAPAVVWAKGLGPSLSEAGRKQGEEVAMQTKFVPGGFFLFLFQVALGKAPGVYTQCVCEMTIERYLSFKNLGFLEQQTTVSSFFLKYSFRRAMLQIDVR